MVPKDIHSKLREAMRHIKFTLELCLKQYNSCRLFMFEHPATASSWSTAMMQEVVNLEGIFAAKFDFCKLGMITDGADGGPALAKKRTTVMTNSSNIAEVLRMAQCAKLHKHAPLVGGKAKACEVYPDQFVELICEGVRKELDDVK